MNINEFLTLRVISHVTLPKSSLRRSKSSLLKSRVMIMLCLPCSFFTQFGTPPCHHYCRQDFPDLDIPHQFFLVSKYGIQQSISSHQVLYHLCQEVLINIFKKPPGSLLACGSFSRCWNGSCYPHEYQGLQA